MRKRTFRDFDREEFDGQAVAGTLPTSWKEALAAYVDWRTAHVKEGLFDLQGTTEFKAKDIAYQCAALAEIQKRLGSEVQKKPRIRIVEPEKRMRLQHDIDLASLLTPKGWEENYGPVIKAMRDDAEREILLSKNVRANQALGAELDELSKFLQRTEQKGRTAIARLENDKRGLDPRRTQGSAVRLVM